MNEKISDQKIVRHYLDRLESAILETKNKYGKLINLIAYNILCSKDDADDLCLHGHAVAYIGNRKLEYECTVSATALYLLKSLTEDHIMCEDNQILPCCGFLIFQMKHLIML